MYPPMETAPEFSTPFALVGWTMLLLFTVGRGCFVGIPDKMTLEFQHRLHCFNMMQSSNRISIVSYEFVFQMDSGCLETSSSLFRQSHELSNSLLYSRLLYLKNFRILRRDVTSGHAKPTDARNKSGGKDRHQWWSVSSG